MNRNRIFAALSLPLVLTLYGCWQLVFGSSDAWVRIGNALGLFVGLVALCVAGGMLFLLRKRDMQWWFWLLISAGCVVVVFAGLIVFVRF